MIYPLEDQIAELEGQFILIASVGLKMEAYTRVSVRSTLKVFDFLAIIGGFYYILNYLSKQLVQGIASKLLQASMIQELYLFDTKKVK
jgi:hypothetical protein